MAALGRNKGDREMELNKYEKSIQNKIDMNRHLNIIDTSKISDGSHTFEELYYHRMMLFAVICNTYKSKAWKSKLHDDGTMYDNYFIVGVVTPKGDYTYHYHMDHWDKFDVTEFFKAPIWDGHKPSDIDRLFSLLEGEDECE